MPEQVGHLLLPRQVLHTTSTVPFPPQAMQAWVLPMPRHAVHSAVPEHFGHLTHVWPAHEAQSWRMCWVIRPVPLQVIHRMGMNPLPVRKPLRWPVPLQEAHAMAFLWSVYPMALQAVHPTVPEPKHVTQRRVPSHTWQTHDGHGTLRVGAPPQVLHVPLPLHEEHDGALWHTGQVPSVHTVQR